MSLLPDYFNFFEMLRQRKKKLDTEVLFILCFFDVFVREYDQAPEGPNPTITLHVEDLPSTAVSAISATISLSIFTFMVWFRQTRPSPKS